ncbi:MAG TPA: hypothetical protein VKT78_03130, partial [Fimbriimonadaceae bacterium]|nr:hypothetical protein [Fimbriimonadaceae bacterium]
PSPVERPARIRRLAHRLPVPTSDILGREAEVGALGELLSENRIVTLLGPGGVGKTRLAIEAGAAELDRRPEGVWFADLSLVSDGSRVAEVVGRALGLRGSLGMGWLDAAVDLIGETNRLLILDNCEHVIEESSRLVEALAEACPAVRILATSRVPLGVRGELRFPVEPLELPAGKPELGILAFPALRLFEARARLVAPRFSLNRESIESTVEICRHVDGLPLGIEMAAARLASMTLADLRGRLSDSLEILRNPVRGSGPRHSTLRGVIEWSYELLPETAKRVLARIAVFEGGWTLEAAQSVCSDSEVSAGEVLDGLTALVEACLVQFRDGRYALLETVRSFANGQLTDSGELTSVRRNLRRYLGSALRDVETLIFSEGPDVVEARFRYELGNLRIALADALTDPSAEDLNLVTDAARVFSTAQLDGEAGSWLEAFLTRPNGRGAPPGRMRALRLASSLYQSYYSDIDRAVARANTIRVCEELGELSRRSKDPDSEAVSLTYLAWIKLFEDPAFSRSCCERAIELSNSAPASSGPQRAMAQLGYLADNAEAFEEGRDWFKRAEEAAQRRGDQATLIFALHGDSHTLREECRYADSIERLKQIERVLENWRDARASAFNDMRFAELYFDLWEFDLMSPHLDRARGFFEATPSRFHGMMLDGLSRYVAAHRGDVELAADGLTNVLRRLVSGAQVSTAAWWNGAAIELEALCVCLAGVGRREDAARVFGAARAFRNRDRQFVSKSVEGRWERLNRYGGFERFDAQIQEGSNLTLDEVLSCVVTLESSLVNSER